MDLSGLEHFIQNIAAFFNVDPSTILLFVGVFVAVCNLAGRLIPDEATGWKGAVRKFCKLVGMYASNRVTKGMSVNDVTKVLLDSKVAGARDDVWKFASQTVEDAARQLK